MPAILKMSATVILAISLTASAQVHRPIQDTYSAQILETIKKNVTDFRSKDPEIRRRSILVLSKYKRHVAAQSVLVMALHDPQPQIRQAALVSLVDGLVDRQAAIAAIRLLDDKEVAIRRICSSALPRLLILARLSVNQSPGMPMGKRAIPRELTAILRKAHLDKDAIVRKNMVAVWGRLRGIVDENICVSMLGDSDRDVRVSALANGLMIIPAKRYLIAIRGLVDDDDRLVRLCLAETLGRYLTPESMGPLETLSKDSDPEIRVKALLGLMKAGRKDAWASLKKMIDGRRLRSADATTAIGALPRLGAVGIATLKTYLKSDNAAFRTAALETLGTYQPAAVTDAALLEFMKDPSSEVRIVAGRILMRRPRIVTTAIDALAGSDHRDVRLFALEFTRHLDRKRAETVLMDLFLDEATEIRKTALMRMASSKINGWRELMIDALDDHDQAIREQAVRGLLSGVQRPIVMSDPCLVPLKRYLEKGANAELKAFIRAQTLVTGSPLK